MGGHRGYRSPLGQRSAGVRVVGNIPGSIGSDVMDQASYKRLEAGFTNDAVKTWTYNVPRKIPIIPRYDALHDRAARSYINSPLTKTILNLTLNLDPLQEPPVKSKFNKLSTRRRCPPSPPPEQVEEREKSFVNDAILTEKLRTKYKDTLLPPYKALTDKHCREYFKQAGVQTTISKTLGSSAGAAETGDIWTHSSYLRGPSVSSAPVSRHFSSSRKY